jgi:hypothetical protein
MQQKAHYAEISCSPGRRVAVTRLQGRANQLLGLRFGFGITLFPEKAGGFLKPVADLRLRL